MSKAESSVQTFLKFADDPSWLSSSQEVLEGDLFAMHNESNLQLNPDIYEVKNGRLWHRKRGFLRGSAVKASLLEEGVIQQLETWFLSNNEGLAVQISPRMEPTSEHAGYPEEQIVIYKIGYVFDPYTFETEKILFFTSHQFRHEFKNREQIRSFIYTEDDKEESILAILNWLKNISDKKVETSLQGLNTRKELAKYFAYQIKSGVPIDTVAQEMNRTKFLGDNPIGCSSSRSEAGTAYNYSNNTAEVLIYNSTLTENSGYFECPRCHGKIKSGLGITTCPHCNLTKEEAGSGCV